MKFIFGLLLIPLLFTSAFAQSNEQIMSTDKGTLDVKISYDKITLGELTTIRTDFINPQSQKIQEHIDWKLTVSKDGETIHFKGIHGLGEVWSNFISMIAKYFMKNYFNYQLVEENLKCTTNSVFIEFR